MESVTESSAADYGAHPFNSVVETGFRALAVLEAFYPKSWDLTVLTWLDHLVVHTSDLGVVDAPPSLHPALDSRGGELVVRRRLIEDSLRLMHGFHLVEIIAEQDGIAYSASEDAPSILGLLEAPYSRALRERAQWLSETFSDSAKIAIVVEQQLGSWNAQFGQGDLFDGLNT